MVMRFKTKFILPWMNSSARGYVHEFGYDVWGNKGKVVIEYLSNCLKNMPKGFMEDDFILAALWGNNGKRMIDCIGLRGIKNNWSGNPEVNAWVYDNGVYIITRNITCGDGLIMLGEEEKFRRTTSSLEEYKYEFPDFGIKHTTLSNAI